MYVIGIGDVRQVSNTTIFFMDDEGKECHKKVNEDDLNKIHGVAWENIIFYERMYKELHELYESRKGGYDKKYKYITDEDIKAEYEVHGRSKTWWDLSLSKDTHNEECRYQWGLVYGVAEASQIASSRRWEADRLYREVQGVFIHLAKPHVEVGKKKKVYVRGK